MQNGVKISIIIPVYNVEEYLEQCLNSVLAQTLADIEVICIDDCSKDTSYNILKEFSQKDNRVKVFHFDECRSALQARKMGVMNAQGEYIMFLDADDYLESHACMKLYEKIQKESVDILHFSSRVINCANVPEQRIKLNEKVILPCEERIENGEVFNACFIKKKYTITLWNKVFKTELCKKAFQNMEDKYLPKAQDLYSFFIIAYYATSYLGWKTEPLHNYCFGRGVTGNSSMNLDKYERYCTQANVVKALENFCLEKEILEKNKAVLERYYKQWLIECVKIWKNELPKEYAVEGLNILYKYWGIQKTVSYLARENWDEKAKIANKIEKLPRILIDKKNVKNIAIYYYHYTIGGVQRVISLLAPLFVKMGYKVILITDKEASENDFPLPEGVTRVNVLSREKINKESYEQRLKSWEKLLKEYQIDLILYNAWTSNVLLWDLLYLKGMGVPVMIHAHSVFSFAVNKLHKEFAELPKYFTLADGIITLSEPDRLFWSAYNDNVYYIPNPVSSELIHAEKGSWDKKALIWVGRVSEEKQPEAVFEILQKVVLQVPETVLYLVGNFADEKWNKMARDKGIEKNIIYCGEMQNVGEYYKKASIHLATSRFEGFLMTLLEAQAHALPTVMFKMPNLMLGTEASGVIGVDMLDCTSAANEIVKLLKNEEQWNAASHLSEESFEKMKAYDFEKSWKQVFIGKNNNLKLPEYVNNMIFTFVNHYEEGIKFAEKKEEAQYLKIKNSKSYKLGRMITFIPRKIRGFIQCCKDHGVTYTIKLFFKKVVHAK